MSLPPPDSFPVPEVVAAAREFIRREGEGCVVSIGQLLDELSDKFGDRFPASPDLYKLVDLIEVLWADPHVDQVPHTGCVEFAWNEKGFDPVSFSRLRAMLPRQAQPATGNGDTVVNRLDAAMACIRLVRDSGADGVIFPQLVDRVRAEFGIEPFGDETMLVDADHPNAVCWNYSSREFLAVIDMMLEHPGIRMARTTAERYYNYGAPLEISLDPDGGDGPLMPPVEGEIAEGGYATPHWVPTMFVWNGEQR